MTLFDDLPFDIIRYIAHFDEIVWYHLTRINANFRAYAYSEGRADFIQRFTIYSCEEINRANISTADDIIMFDVFNKVDHNKTVTKESWKLFGKLHSNDTPSAVFSIDGMIIAEAYHYNDMIHRENDLPAVIGYTSGQIFREEWYFYGLIHRENSAAAIIYKNGKIKHTIYYRYGVCSRKNETGETNNDLPQSIQFYSTEVIKRKYWYTNNKLYRLDGPYFMEYYPNGNLWKLRWKNANQLRHCDNGPAEIIYSNNGNKTQEIYYKDGLIHRDYGPAIIQYNPDQNAVTWFYYKNDKMHNELGPALIRDFSENDKFHNYFLNNERTDCFGVLPLNVKIQIASADILTWKNLFIIDSEFYTYSRSEQGLENFSKLYFCLEI